MPVLLAAIFLLAGNGAEFHGPAAEWVSIDPTSLAVDLSVTLSGSDGPVAAHLVLPGEPEQVIPLANRGGGTWGSVVEIRKADWRVVFEDLESGALTAATPLTELGVERTSVAGASAVVEEDEPPALPVAAALATVGGVLFVAMGAAFIGRRRLAPRHRSVRGRRRRLPTRRHRSAPN